MNIQFTNGINKLKLMLITIKKIPTPPGDMRPKKIKSRACKSPSLPAMTSLPMYVSSHMHCQSNRNKL